MSVDNSDATLPNGWADFTVGPATCNEDSDQACETSTGGSWVPGDYTINTGSWSVWPGDGNGDNQWNDYETLGQLIAPGANASLGWKWLGTCPDSDRTGSPLGSDAPEGICAPGVSSSVVVNSTTWDGIFPGSGAQSIGLWGSVGQ
jgi:hypothetical protein